MLLSHIDIEDALKAGEIAVEPYDGAHLQPASLDLRLGGTETGLPYIAPNEFCLATTQEVVSLRSHRYAAQVAGKSTWARRGLIVEAAGWVDPGFSGQLTLELHNMSSHLIALPVGEAICQVVFFQMRTPTYRLYAGHYQHQRGATRAHG